MSLRHLMISTAVAAPGIRRQRRRRRNHQNRRHAGSSRSDPRGGKADRGQERSRHSDRRIHRLCSAQCGAGRRGSAGEFVSKPALSRQSKGRSRLQDRTCRVNRQFPDGRLFEEIQKLGRGAAGRDIVDPERSDQWRPRAVAAAGQGRAEAQAGRRIQADHRRHHREPPKIQDCRGRRGADRTHA